jgi:hypothetical protein
MFELMRHDVTFPLYVEVDEIYHLACPASPIHYQRDPVQTTKTSVHGSINMLGLAKRTKARILLASTSEVYGDPTVHPQPEDYWGNVNPIGPRSCYDEGKRCAETLLVDYRRQHGIDVRIARIFNTYGPRMRLRRRPGGEQLHHPGPARRALDGLRRRHPDALLLLRRRPRGGLLALMAHADPTTVRSTSATPRRSRCSSSPNRRSTGSRSSTATTWQVPRDAAAQHPAAAGLDAQRVSP